MVGEWFILSADPLSLGVIYSGAMHPSVQEFFAEPAVDDPPARVARDWWLVAALVIAAIAEWIFNDKLIWRTFHIAVTMAIIPTVLWRRTRPLLMLAIAFVSMNSLLLFDALFAEIPEGPYTAIFVVFLVYSLFRWGSGRHCAFGLGAIFAAMVLNLIIDPGTVGDFVGGIIFISLPIEAGILVRYQRRSADQRVAEVRSVEREQIARELHDSVAHHVSAIAIQAQAARAVAATNPEAVVGSLEAIEEAAARALSDMRSMVGSLRDGSEVELAPQQGLQDIASLAGARGGLDVLVGPLPDGEPAAAVGAALFRIAQESVTNAVRHSDDATTVDVQVSNGGDSYRLIVRDDGKTMTEQNVPGYGLIGMAERARLLGGTLTAGPASGGGWLVEAELPAPGLAR